MKGNLKNKMKDRMRKKIHILPNFVTACNLVMGVNAIMLALGAFANNDFSSKRLTQASMCVFFGMVFDVFDGFVARLTKTSSRFGMELDSLADLVTFGVAPSVLFYVFVLQTVPAPIRKLALPCCMVYTCCAALRLARFNAQIEDEGKTFSGIPTPEAAGVIISYLLLLSHGYLSPATNNVHDFLHNFIMPFVPVVLGLLMVSTWRFPAPAKQIVWQRHPFVYLVLIVFLLVALIFKPGLVLPFIFIGYLFYGFIQVIRKAFSKRPEETDEQGTE